MSDLYYEAFYAGPYTVHATENWDPWFPERVGAFWVSERENLQQASDTVVNYRIVPKNRTVRSKN